MKPTSATTERHPPGAGDPAWVGQIPQPVGAGAGASATGRFPLTQRFGVVALLAIGAIAALSLWLLSSFVTQRMLLQEGVLTRDFVRSLLLVEKPLLAYFTQPQAGAPAHVEDSFEHFALMPDMLRTNVYDAQRRVLWSSDAQLIGRQFGPNDELDQALAGAVIVEKKTDAERLNGKAEYESLAQPDDLFIEIYVPVLDPTSGRVLGAIEFYKNPRGLMRSLNELRLFIALGAAVFALLLFGALFSLVRRADQLIHAQQARLVEAETFAVVGEMSSVVAHGIRNPLAVIRSSAELILDSARGGPAQHPAPALDAATAEAARDIVEQSDRLGAWVRDLLSYTRPSDNRPQALALAPLVDSCLQDMAREFDRRGVQARALLADKLPLVRGDALAVGQVLRSVLANALDAVPDGGHVTVRAALDADGRHLTLTVHDNGPGMTPEQRSRAGKPFFTTKAHGMGVGLALARRVLDRSGGFLRIDSEPGRGTVVAIGLCTA
jgi:two-component system, NtrC family, sensor histidine kinase HydH